MPVEYLRLGIRFFQHNQNLKSTARATMERFGSKHIIVSQRPLDLYIFEKI